MSPTNAPIRAARGLQHVALMLRLRPPNLVLVLLTACSSNFSSLSPGTYECTASVAMNTCGPTLASSSMSQTVDGAGSDIISFDAPSHVAVLEAPTVRWDTMQFGAQDDPFLYETTLTASCSTNVSYMAREASMITSLRTDAFDATITYNYTGLAPCGVPDIIAADSCVVSYAMSCARLTR